jgi:hypothetical protein
VSDTTTKPACPAVRVLCGQFIANVQAGDAELRKMAYESDGLSPDEWAFDIGTATYTKREA